MAGLFKQKWTKGGISGESKKWYGEYRDHRGKVRRVALSTDKQVARTMLVDLQRESERRKVGITDEFSDARKSSVADLITQYLRHLRLKGDGDRHIADTARLLILVTSGCKIETLGDLDSSALDDYLDGLTRKDGCPTSARTKNTHRQALMGFTRWCVQRKKLKFNPLEHSTKPVGETRVVRRAITLDLLRHLMDVAKNRPLQERMMVRMGPNKGTLTAKVRPEVRTKLERQGRLRALLYKTAFYTGLRRNELRQMEVHHLILDAQPRVELPSSITKNRKAASLPIRPDHALELINWIRAEGLGMTDKVFPVGRDVAKYLKRDMKAAGIPLRDERGWIFDFHSLRKCTGTYMNKANVPIMTTKEMLRHSTVELTAGVYNDGELHDLRAAIDTLPSL